VRQVGDLVSHSLEEHGKCDKGSSDKETLNDPNNCSVRVAVRTRGPDQVGKRAGRFASSSSRHADAAGDDGAAGDAGDDGDDAMK